MVYCLVCQEEMDSQLGWNGFLKGAYYSKICDRCLIQFDKIEEPTCASCSKPSKKEKCRDCTLWQTLYNGKDPLRKNISIFKYNDFMKELITNWKYRGDYMLGEVFRDVYFQAFKEHFQPHEQHPTIIPIPLSEIRMKERGFNQSLMLAEFISTSIEQPLHRLYDTKQAKKRKHERISSKNPFKLTKSINNSVVLVDDIYTTGSTIRHAAVLLKNSGCKDVYSFTLIRG